MQLLLSNSTIYALIYLALNTNRKAPKHHYSMAIEAFLHYSFAFFYKNTNIFSKNKSIFYAFKSCFVQISSSVL